MQIGYGMVSNAHVRQLTVFLSAAILTQSSAVPKFLRSRGLFQPVSPYLVRNLIRLCNMHRLWSRAGHSWRLLTRIRSLSTHCRERCKLSLVFCRGEIQQSAISNRALKMCDQSFVLCFIIKLSRNGFPALTEEINSTIKTGKVRAFHEV